MNEKRRKMAYTKHRIGIVSLVDQVYESLRRTIFKGELKDGERIVELEIANQMGISQGPVREALQRLDNDGLVERRARSATYVSTISIDKVFDLFEIRNAIETHAIHHTAQIISPSQIDELQSLVDAMSAAAKANDLISLTTIDIQFHQRLVEWSGDRTLLLSWIPLFSQIQRFKIRYHRHFFPNLEEIAEIHQPIINALRKHDVEQATHLLSEHISLYKERKIRETLLQELASETKGSH
jgi:DNA-binding GntR family transcriptional regulator